MLASLTDQELRLTEAARQKMGELFEDIDDNIAGVRVYAASGGCSGVSFGMTFTDAINDNDGVREYDSYKVVVDDGTLEHIRGVEIDFVDRGTVTPPLSSMICQRPEAAAGAVARPRPPVADVRDPRWLPSRRLLGSGWRLNSLSSLPASVAVD